LIVTNPFKVSLTPLGSESFLGDCPSSPPIDMISTLRFLRIVRSNRAFSFRIVPEHPFFAQSTVVCLYDQLVRAPFFSPNPRPPPLRAECYIPPHDGFNHRSLLSRSFAAPPLLPSFCFCGHPGRRTRSKVVTGRFLLQSPVGTRRSNYLGPESCTRCFVLGSVSFLCDPPPVCFFPCV